jgi:hypothetical protein
MRLTLRAIAFLASALVTYRLLFWVPPGGEKALRIIGRISWIVVFLTLCDVILVPILVIPQPAVGRRVAGFAAMVLVAHLGMRRGGACLSAMTISGLLLAADAVLRLLINASVPGLAINGPEALDGFGLRSDRRSFRWTGQIGYPKEFAVTAHWNRWGFNDREPPSGQSPPIILVLGDSYVEGLQVPQTDIFYRVAEARLLAKGRSVRMVGLGESDTGACATMQRLDRYGSELQPSLVVYAFVYNDVRDDYVPWRNETADIAAHLPPFLSGRIVTFVPALDWLRFYIRQHAVAWLSRHWSRLGMNPDSLMFISDGSAEVAQAWAVTLRCAEEMAAWARQRGSAFAILELPPGSPEYAHPAGVVSLPPRLTVRRKACHHPRRRRGGLRSIIVRKTGKASAA